MAYVDRSQITRTDDRDIPLTRELMAGILLASLAATIGIRQLVPAEAIAPALVTLLFAAGAATAGLALLSQRSRFRSMWFDLAGGLTFIGIIISIFIEPDQLARLFTVSEQSD